MSRVTRGARLFCRLRKSASSEIDGFMRVLIIAAVLQFCSSLVFGAYPAGTIQMEPQDAYAVAGSTLDVTCDFRPVGATVFRGNGVLRVAFRFEVRRKRDSYQNGISQIVRHPYRSPDREQRHSIARRKISSRLSQQGQQFLFEQQMGNSHGHRCYRRGSDYFGRPWNIASHGGRARGDQRDC